jgi:hypothetical protein
MPLDTLHRLQSGQLLGTKHLKLSCGLTQFPMAIFDLADTLEVLDLSGNALSDLPPDLYRLKRLRVLFASSNQFTHLPSCIGACESLSMVGFKANQIREVPAQALPPQLRWLILTDNCIEQLPSELGRRPLMQKLMLAGNRLQALPDALAQCRQLELLRISANRFPALPSWLTSLPRLSWLAYAGNPLDHATQTQALKEAQASAIEWSALTLGAPLGEGASGVIHEALWHAPSGPQTVALKRFKAAMTSDGLPDSEMAACLAAGTHAHLIGVHGQLTGHPDQGQGLVMQHIGRGYQPLAGPPSFETCTRDVYAADLNLTLEAALALAAGMARVGAHLHARGILHGDLYAHNILWNAQGHALLGDFGAASLLPTHDAALALALTQLEVRALGCLLEELQERVSPAPEGSSNTHQAPTLAALKTLQQQCCQPHAAQRPSMAQIATTLQALMANLH